MIDYGKKGHKIALIAIIFSLIAISAIGSTISGVTIHYHNYSNNSGSATIATYTEWENTIYSLAENLITGNYTEFELSPQYIYAYVDYAGSYNEMYMNYNYTYFNKRLTVNGDINLTGHNITNCGNCTGGSGSFTDNLSWQTEKVNKSGDNISNAIFEAHNTTVNNVTTLNISGKTGQGMSVKLNGYNSGFAIGRNNNFIGSFSGANLSGSGGSSYMFLFTNRYWDDSFVLKDLTYPARYGSGFIVAGLGTQATFDWKYVLPNDPAQVQRTGLSVNNNGNLTINGTSNSLSTFSGNVTISGLAGPGNTYLCVNSAGKPYRGNPTC